jgi:hypothetical protein
MADEQQVNKYALMLVELEAERSKIDNAIAAIKQLMGAESADGGTSAPAGAPVPPKRQDLPSKVEFDTFFSLSIPEAIKKFLAMMKRPQTLAAITDALTAGGLSTTATDLMKTVTATLARMRRTSGEVVLVRRGEWGLKEWYPGRRFEQPEPKKSKPKKRGRSKGSHETKPTEPLKDASKGATTPKPTPEQIEQIKKMGAVGKKPGEIAKEVGLHHFAVMGVLKSKMAKAS